jgi:uncharacterized membrane protein HdeD (DUF308 family)
MDTPMGMQNAQMGASPAGVPTQSTQARELYSQLAKWWWAWLVLGSAWIIVALIILQFNRHSVVIVGIVTGVLFVVAGVQELGQAALTTSGWKWLWIAFGAILVVGGFFALLNPVHTFLALADTLGFLFVLIGIMWMIEALATMQGNPVWWLGLFSGILMISLGFWAGGQPIASNAATLLVFAGVWALLHGITDIARAFQFRRLGALAVASAPMAPGALSSPSAPAAG